MSLLLFIIDTKINNLTGLVITRPNGYNIPHSRQNKSRK